MEYTQEEKQAAAEIARSILPQLRKAQRSGGRCMVAVWHVNGGDLNLWRKCFAFPRSEFDNSVDVLETDIRKEKAEYGLD
jgi:hypothetical protein